MTVSNFHILACDIFLSEIFIESTDKSIMKNSPPRSLLQRLHILSFLSIPLNLPETIGILLYPVLHLQSDIASLSGN